jgi:hypothetical protein
MLNKTRRHDLGQNIKTLTRFIGAGCIRMHDPSFYHDPVAFKLERFLEADSQKPEIDPHSGVASVLVEF